MIDADEMRENVGRAMPTMNLRWYGGVLQQEYEIEVSRQYFKGGRYAYTSFGSVRREWRNIETVEPDEP